MLYANFQNTEGQEYLILCDAACTQVLVLVSVILYNSTILYLWPNPEREVSCTASLMVTQLRDNSLGVAWHCLT